MTNRGVIIGELKKVDFSQLDDASLFNIFCETHDDNCTGCPFVDEYCPAGSETYILNNASWWMGSMYNGGEDD